MGVFKRYKDAQAAQKDAENAMPGAYQSNYTDRINETLDSMGAASNAGYDVGTDSELYRQYRAGAQANARAAAENAAAGAAALSGGYGSSYANSVAQQGYQQAMANVDDGLAGLRDKALTMYQLKQNGLSGLLSALQNQDSLERRSIRGLWPTRRTGGTTRRAGRPGGAGEERFSLEPVGDGEECGQSRSDGLRHLQGLHPAAVGERVCPGTVGVQQRAHRPERCTECLRAGVQPVPAGSGRCRERRAGPVWSGHWNLRQLQRRTHHPRRQGGCAHDCGGLAGSGSDEAARAVLELYGLDPNSVGSYGTIAGRQFATTLAKKSAGSSGGSSGSRSSGSTGNERSAPTYAQLLSMSKEFVTMKASDPRYDYYKRTLTDAGWIKDDTPNLSSVPQRAQVAANAIKGQRNHGSDDQTIFDSLKYQGYTDDEIWKAFELAG